MIARAVAAIVAAGSIIWLCFFTDLTAAQSLLLLAYFIADYVGDHLSRKKLA